MITIITGKPGSGKTALLTALCCKEYKENGRKIFNNSQELITQLNKSRKNKLTLPGHAPIYTDYDIQIPIGYNKIFEPYYGNGFFIGMKNNSVPTLALPPFSKVFLQEVGKYFDSRKKTLPEWVSRYFEKHRHWHVDFYLDLQRGMLVDKNIRDISGRIIVIQSFTHKYDKLNNIVQSTWECYEFSSATDYEKFLEDGSKTYSETTYIHKGNIFRLYDSFNCSKEFIPEDKCSLDFNYLPHRSPDEISALAPQEAKFYCTEAPKGYWSQEQTKEEKNDNGNQTKTRRTQSS